MTSPRLRAAALALGLTAVHALGATACGADTSATKTSTGSVRRAGTKSLISSLLVSGPTSTELRGLAARSGVLV